MYRKVFLLTAIVLIASTAATAQTKTKPAEEVTEEVDGVFELVGYLGKKVFDEVGNQMDFDESDEDEKKTEPEIKRVRIKLGPIKIERIDRK